jgi:hypothetical protein
MNVLLSYHYFKDPDLIKKLSGLGLNLLIDSGAFSAFTLGKEIDVDEYADYLKEIEPYVDGYFNLDVIGSPQGSANNHKRLQSLGLRPIPVWQGHDKEMRGIRDFIDGEDYVALGSLVGMRGVKKTKLYNEKRIHRFMQAVGDRKVHLLGYTKRKGIRTFKPYSCDSCNDAYWVISGGKHTIYGPELKPLTIEPFCRVEDHEFEYIKQKLHIEFNNQADLFDFGPSVENNGKYCRYLMLLIAEYNQGQNTHTKQYFAMGALKDVKMLIRVLEGKG